MDQRHYPVLLEETIRNLNIKEDGIYVDGTFGMGGHSAQILKRLVNGRLIGIDKDNYAINNGKERFASYSDRLVLVHDDFGNVCEILESLCIEKVDGKNLAYLQNGENYLFALVDDCVAEGEDYGFSILYDKMTVKANGEDVALPIEDEVSLNGRFSKKELRENGERVLHFYYNIGKYSVEAEKENGYKINSIDKDHCYDYTYRYVLNRDNIRTVSDGEDGLDVDILEKLDYGRVCYAKAKTEDGQELLIKTDKDFDGTKAKIAFDAKDVSVYSTRIDMMLC